MPLTPEAGLPSARRRPPGCRRHSAARVNAIKAANGSEIVVMGHSLGCMLTSAAIADGGMQADKFFALNGAVPAEAFDPAMADEQTNALTRIIHERPEPRPGTRLSGAGERGWG